MPTHTPSFTSRATTSRPASLSVPKLPSSLRYTIRPSPAASAISRSPASRPAASRGSPLGSAIAHGKEWRRSSAAWSMARPKEGPTLGLAHGPAAGPASHPSSSSYSPSVTWYRNALPPYRKRVMPPAAMCRTRRSFSLKSMARSLLRRASGGTANTPRRSSGRTGLVFMGRASLRRGAGRAARDEVRGDQLRRGRRGVALQAAHQGGGRALGQRVARQAHRRERRIGQAGEGDVVEAHDRHVARDGEAGGAAGLHHAQRHQIVGGQDGGGAGVQGQDLLARAQPALEPEVAFLDRARGAAEVAPGGGPEGADTLVRGAQARGPAHVGEVAVSQLGQVAYRLVDAARIVDGDGARLVDGARHGGGRDARHAGDVAQPRRRTRGAAARPGRHPRPLRNRRPLP